MQPFVCLGGQCFWETSEMSCVFHLCTSFASPQHFIASIITSGCVPSCPLYIVHTGVCMSTTLCKPPFFQYYVNREWVTSSDDFSERSLILAECMQKTCGNLNPRLPKNWSNALICDFYWRLSHIFTMQSTVAIIQLSHMYAYNSCAYHSIHTRKLCQGLLVILTKSSVISMHYRELSC